MNEEANALAEMIIDAKKLFSAAWRSYVQGDGERPLREEFFIAEYLIKKWEGKK